jgi:hypothetical protein
MDERAETDDAATPSPLRWLKLALAGATPVLCR